MSQLDPLPKDLPFRIVSKTVGRGAYASIKKAIPLDATDPVFAVKLIHKGYALKHGRITVKQLAMEVSLHSHIGQHPNIIEWFAAGEDNTWKWIAMEYAEGGDLFDKIEADVGVRQDIAQVYFCQLVSGVSFIHSKGVAHRDLKPENILLSQDGSLKLADFGMSTMFEYKGQRKASSTLCGSPPYIAPEILACGRADRKTSGAAKYLPDLVDIWSCGVILFVLLVGNTPWDEPATSSWEFQEYVKTSGRSSDALWARVPPEALSLLRGMMSVDPEKRFSFNRIRQHPWYTRHNPFLTAEGKVSDPLNLATQMLENLHIDFSQRPTTSQSTQEDMDMDMDSGLNAGRFSSTQPETPITPITDQEWDWERPVLRSMAAPASSVPARGQDPMSRVPLGSLADEPSMSQFCQNPGPSMTLTQHARRFGDICPRESLTRFFSHAPPAHLVQMLGDALHQLNVPLAPVTPNLHANNVASIKVRGLDGRQQNLHGEIQIHRHGLVDAEVLDVQFVKVKGDPLEWRRFFKKVVVLCKDGVYVPEA
ncbi:kinase-like domain-containing protein [Emericellopsis atlantica]|uniref:non-specific serine/threonine protein kinase n=1 Tax=Emericellopsis atlantica TaxID=2614577 RepID=A0A9P8CRA2_9HYPO|nr:kinase-like domain-containing protein [Emericellopsis atlantica]KAG9256092.1 kinase-like domain-containing protein [Emericellopsis atlantica]